MDACNISTFTALSSPIPYVVDTVGAIGSIFLIVLIVQTPSLKGYSGALLGTEQVACLVEQLSSIATTVALQYPENTPKAVFFSLTLTAKNVSLVLLMTINCNLCLAITCKMLYNSVVNWKRIMAAVVANLCWNIPLGIYAMVYTDYFVFDCDSGGIPYPAPSLATMWHPFLYLIQAVTALCINCVSLVKICRRPVRVDVSLSTQSRTEKKITLAKFILLLSIMYTFTYVVLYSLFYAKLHLTVVGVDIDAVILVFVNLNKIYVNLRPCFYLPLYRPLFQTLRRLACGKKRGVVNVLGVPGTTCERRKRPGSVTIGNTVV